MVHVCICTHVHVHLHVLRPFILCEGILFSLNRQGHAGGGEEREEEESEHLVRGTAAH